MISLLEIIDRFFKKDGKPTEPLKNILELCQVKHNGTLSGIRDATQKAWYQKDKLHFEIQERHSYLREVAMPLFEKLGMVRSVHVSKEKKFVKFDVALIHGGSLKAVQKRVTFLDLEWYANEVRFKTVGLIGSRRQLKESEQLHLMEPVIWGTKFDVPAKDESNVNTEFEMMCEVYKRAHLIFRNKISPILGPSAIAKADADTEETLREWLKEHSSFPTSILFISSQPFVQHQHLIAEKILKDRCQVVTIGCQAYDIPITTFLDTLAKTIYEIHEIALKKRK